MKIKITKDTNGHTDIELVHDTAKKPVKVQLNQNQLQGLLDVLRTVVTANTFKFELEL